jgi:HAMP domain-containing protein
VYRAEKREHLFYTGLFEAVLVVVSAVSWFAYRHLERRLGKQHRAKQLELQQAQARPQAQAQRGPSAGGPER